MPTHYHLRVYIAGMTPAASRAIANLKEICAEVSNAHTYEVEVVDIHEHPQLAEDERILATPMVIRTLPPPVRRLVGDLSDRDQAVLGLELREE